MKGILVLKNDIPHIRWVILKKWIFDKVKQKQDVTILYTTVDDDWRDVSMKETWLLVAHLFSQSYLDLYSGPQPHKRIWFDRRRSWFLNSFRLNKGQFLISKSRSNRYSPLRLISENHGIFKRKFSIDRIRIFWRFFFFLNQ